MATESTSRLMQTVTSLTPVVLTAIVTLTTTYVTGFFGIWSDRETRKGQLQIAEREFSYELLKEAIAIPDDIDRAAELLFLAEIELIKEPSINVDRLKALSNAKLDIVNAPKETRAFPSRGASDSLASELRSLSSDDRVQRATARVELSRRIVEAEDPYLNQEIVEYLADSEIYREQIGIAVALGMSTEPIPFVDSERALVILNDLNAETPDQTLKIRLQEAIAAVDKA